MTLALALAALSLNSPPPVVQKETYTELETAFVAAMEAKEMKKLPAIGMKLAKTKDPRAIPLMIGAIQADGTLDTVYGLGMFGLASITGVTYDESHDAAWWIAWWDANKANYPPTVRDAPLPTFKGFDAKPAVRPPDADDVRDIPSKALYAGGDRSKLFFLSGPVGAAPASGHKLLLVLPGGDGGKDFHPFVKRIQKHALPEGYLVAQLVSPKWDSSQQIVWPTAGLPASGMKFSTEEFIEAAITEVKKTHKVNPRYVFTLGWSSGGPAVYAHAASKARSATGAFVAMSVFKPDQLPTGGTVQGFPLYILHSPEDRIPISFAERARTELSGRGAKVGFATYPGGHGWVSDPYGNIRAGIEFLEANAR